MEMTFKSPLNDNAKTIEHVNEWCWKIITWVSKDNKARR